VKWVKLCKSEKNGGVSIKNIRKLNISLLCKWWWKLENENGLWQEIVKAKYFSRSNIQNISHKLGDSPIWSDLLKIKPIYLQGRSIKIGNGANIRFWEDSWLTDSPLCSLIPVLYALSEQKGISVADVKTGIICITFRRWLPLELQNIWDMVWSKVEIFQLSEAEDKIRWKIGKKKVFTVKSVYNALTCEDSGYHFKHIWKGKIPAKLKFFM
jgi:hypothetical protein